MRHLENMEMKLWHSIRRAVFLCGVAVGAFCVHATEEVIWWQVDDDPDVDTFHDGIKKASALGADEARIVTSSGDYLVIPPPDQESLEVSCSLLKETVKNLQLSVLLISHQRVRVVSFMDYEISLENGILKEVSA